MTIPAYRRANGPRLCTAAGSTAAPRTPASSPPGGLSVRAGGCLRHTASVAIAPQATESRPEMALSLCSCAPDVRIFSGIQPTGRKHLGNYIGAIRQYVEGQERGDGDLLHRRPPRADVPYDPADLRERLYDTLAILLAAGLDPERSVLFRQSDVPEHTELPGCFGVTPWATSTGCTSSATSRCAQRELVAAGCSSTRCSRRPTCSAYRADEVPVGEDQREHLELMRDVARRFNARFGEGISWSPSTGSPRSARGSWTSRSRRARCRRPAAPSRARSTSSTSPRRSRRSSSAR